MEKVEAQRSQASQRAPQRPGGSAALESPQGQQIAQLEAMAEASPQVGSAARFGEMANGSPQAAAQRRTMNMIGNSPRMAAQGKVAGAMHNSLNIVAQRQQLDILSGETAQREETEERLQPKVAQREEAPAKPNNTGLPDNLKSGIESLSGISMDSVRVHYNSSQPAQLNALAYAQGTDIHVAPGQERHLPHEAWHVVQQAQGRVSPTMQMKARVPVNDDRSLEYEADVMGAKAASIGVAQGKSIEAAPIAAIASVMQRRAETKMLLDTFRRVCTEEGYVAGATYLLDNGDTQFTDNNFTTANLLIAEFPQCAEFAHSKIGIGSFIGNICSALYKLNPDNEQAGEEFAPDESMVTEDDTNYDEEDHGDSGGEFEDLSSDDQSKVDNADGYGMIERFEKAGGTVQFQALGNKVGDKKTHGKYTVSYKTTSQGSINFNNPHTLSPKSGFGPWVHKAGSTVNILKGKSINYVAKGGKVYTWSEKAKDRGLHFAAANYIYNGTRDRSSPPGWTWHHLEHPVGGMVLVRREVHSKHHHNGGVFLW